MPMLLICENCLEEKGKEWFEIAKNYRDMQTQCFLHDNRHHKNKEPRWEILDSEIDMEDFEDYKRMFLAHGSDKAQALAELREGYELRKQLRIKLGL